MERGFVSDPEGSPLPVVQSRWHDGERRRGDSDPLGERAGQHPAEDVAAEPASVAVRADRDDPSGELAAYRERRRGRLLVGIREDQQIGEVDGCSPYLDEDLLPRDHRFRHLVECGFLPEVATAYC